MNLVDKRDNKLHKYIFYYSFIQFSIISIDFVDSGLSVDFSDESGLNFSDGDWHLYSLLIFSASMSESRVLNLKAH